METKVDLIAGHLSAIKVVRTARIILEGHVFTKKNYKIVEATYFRHWRKLYTFFDKELNR